MSKHVYAFTHTHTRVRSKFFFTFPLSNTFHSPCITFNIPIHKNKRNVATLLHTHTHTQRKVHKAKSRHSHERSSFFACSERTRQEQQYLSCVRDVCVCTYAYVVLLLLFEFYSFCLPLASHSTPAAAAAQFLLLCSKKRNSQEYGMCRFIVHNVT